MVEVVLGAVVNVRLVRVGIVGSDPSIDARQLLAISPNKRRTNRAER